MASHDFPLEHVYCCVESTVAMLLISLHLSASLSLGYTVCPSLVLGTISNDVRGDQCSSSCRFQVFTHAPFCISSRQSETLPFLQPSVSDCHRRSSETNRSWTFHRWPRSIPWVKPGDPQRRTAKLSPARFPELKEQLFQSTKCYGIFFSQQKSGIHSTGCSLSSTAIIGETMRCIYRNSFF